MMRRMAGRPSTSRTPRHLRWARATVIGVFLVGVVVVVGPALAHMGTLFKNPFTVPVERKTVETFDEHGTRTGTQVTTEPAGSFVERALSSGGVLLLRIGVVAAAAFLAGALVDRTMSGSFPSEIAGVKFAEQAGAGLEDLRVALGVLTTKLDGLGGEVERLKAAGVGGVVAVDALEEQLGATQAEVDQLHDAVKELKGALATAPARRRPAARPPA